MIRSYLLVVLAKMCEISEVILRRDIGQIEKFFLVRTKKSDATFLTRK
jgi:hypothetical protein